MSEHRFAQYIEQAIEPIRANPIRKDRMREELAAHLAAIYDEERGRLGDDQAAADQAIRRMGAIGELTQSLAESVPRFEQSLFTPFRSLHWVDALDRVVCRRQDESPLHHAARMTIGMTTVIAGMMMIVTPAAVAVEHRQPDWRLTCVWAAATLTLVAAGSFMFPLICHGMSRALERGRSGWPRAGLFAALTSTATIGCGLAFAFMVSLGSPVGPLFRVSDWPRLLVISLVAALLMTGSAYANSARRRRVDGWGISQS